MQKVTGVSSVRVSLNDGLTVLELKPGNTVTVARLREVIRNNGFVTREAKVVASGTVAASGNDLAFEVGGTRERFLILTSTNEQRQRADELRATTKSATATLLITGVVDITDPKSMKMTVNAVGSSQH
jgi:hypothetical protein